MTMTPHAFRSPVVLLLLGVCLLIFCGGEGNANAENPLSPTPATNQGPLKLLMPQKSAYTGAYVDFGEGESNVTYDALVGFEQLTGKHLAVVGFGNFWGDQAFPDKSVRIVAAYGAVPMLYWSPWDKPYSESKGPDRFNLHHILSGQWDSYIDAWADGARAYGKPLLVTWGLEMNGIWFPWSGKYYGGGKIIGHKDGHPLYAGPETFKQAYRYVIDRVRARGANNILWGFHVNNFSDPQKEWNKMAQYYPGKEYVDWLGLSVYGKLNRSEGWADFVDMMHVPYHEIAKLDADTPIFLAEWGVGEFPPGDKAGFIGKAFTLIPTQYPRVRLAVFWHERWENSDGSFSNLRAHSSPESLDAYRKGVADPYWIDQPKFAPKP
ncbi:MAG: glycosyl hydrolase [Desulfobulbus sp.]|nr:glycosyl hydrolase [Desulfobulbus sp.]